MNLSMFENYTDNTEGTRVGLKKAFKLIRVRDKTSKSFFAFFGCVNKKEILWYNLPIQNSDFFRLNFY